MEGDASVYPPATDCQLISIHSLRVEGDTPSMSVRASASDFNPLPPCGGRLDDLITPPAADKISIHSLRVEGDVQSVSAKSTLLGFQSTPSVWRETTGSIQGR